MLQSLAQQSPASASGLQPGADYLAVVADNNDPDKLQRVRVTIPGLLEADNAEDLPWVAPAQCSLFGVGDNFGVLRVPRVGSKVFVRYGDSPPTSGVYTGDAVTARTALAPELLENYPNRVGFSTPSGDLCYTDLTQKTFYYRHSSGTSMEILGDGTLRVNVAKDMQTTVTGDYTLTVQGSSTVSVQGDSTRTTQGNESATVSGNMSNNVQGSMSNIVSSKITTVCSKQTHVGKFNNADDVVAGGRSLKNHVHMLGSSTTSPPM